MTPAVGTATDTVDVQLVRQSAPPDLARVGCVVNPTFAATELPVIPAVHADEGAL